MRRSPTHGSHESKGTIMKKLFSTTLALAAFLGAVAPALAVSPGTFDPRDPNSLTKAPQAQKPYALTGSSREAKKPNDTQVQVNNQLGARAVISTRGEARD
jgi:hypothetical protein